MKPRWETNASSRIASIVARSCDPRLGLRRSFVLCVFICYSKRRSSDMSQYRIRGKSGQEIADSIEQAIEQGALAPGETLPAVRALARELAVSPTTVSAALGELRSRG